MDIIDVTKKQIEEKEKEVHGLRVRVKELSEENFDLKKKLEMYKTVQSDFGYDLVAEDPDPAQLEIDLLNAEIDDLDNTELSENFDLRSPMGH